MGMKFFRNPEIVRMLLVHGMVSVAAVVMAFLLPNLSPGLVWTNDIFELRFGFFTLILCLMFVSVYLISTYRRYRRIAELSEEIDYILHDNDRRADFTQYTEGELGILQSEVHKMTIRLREQAKQLKEDKRYLADSIADISHQIRTPLTSVNLQVQLLSEPDLTEERRRKLTYELYAQLSRIDWLITALLKISKLDAKTVRFEPETISLAQLIQKSVVSVLVPMELRGQELKVQADGTCFCDVSWTGEALTNIIKNCMEHTPDGGTIEVRATENAIYSEIVIADNGVGIDKEDLPHIFERFYKGKNSGENSFGIGLALSRMIINGQNGTIKVRNRAPKGAEFTIRFYKGTV